MGLPLEGCLDNTRFLGALSPLWTCWLGGLCLEDPLSGDSLHLGLQHPRRHGHAPGASSIIRVRAFTKTVSANQDLDCRSP